MTKICALVAATQLSIYRSSLQTSDAGMQERPIPSAALRDSESWELLRVWIAEKRMHCSLKVGVYEQHGPLPEDQAWGIILADAAKHIADALGLQGVRDREAALTQIAQSFLAEINDPTSATQGTFANETGT